MDLNRCMHVVDYCTMALIKISASDSAMVRGTVVFYLSYIIGVHVLGKFTSSMLMHTRAMARPT